MDQKLFQIECGSIRIGEYSKEELLPMLKKKIFSKSFRFKEIKIPPVIETKSKKLDKTKKKDFNIIYRSNLGSSFFCIPKATGERKIEINKDHSSYPLLLKLFSPGTEKFGDSKSERLLLKKILFSWARLESEAVGKDKRKMQTIREDWGRFLEEDLSENTD